MRRLLFTTRMGYRWFFRKTHCSPIVRLLTTADSILQRNCRRPSLRICKFCAQKDCDWRDSDMRPTKAATTTCKQPDCCSVWITWRMPRKPEQVCRQGNPSTIGRDNWPTGKPTNRSSSRKPADCTATSRMDASASRMTAKSL